ncbi:23S rRNA (uracil(1939)-C(5))-methyltransferase RlmD [Candidatus Poribacteria bacterium]|nr:23S rRNA (uracil(1939)-C(5))-methyltransferase RlmD [Candidatus Poribacteria bacterium]
MHNSIKENQIFEAEITEITYKGKSVCRYDNFVVFLDHAIPGDKVRARITKVKKTYGEGEIISMIEPSKARIKAPCDYFQICGGCQFQGIDYSHQLKFKEIIVSNCLKHIGKLDTTVNSILPSPKTFEYRNQIQLKVQISSEVKIGFYRTETHEIIKIDKCLLQTKIGNSILAEIRKFFNKENNNSFVEPLLFNIILRVSDEEKKALIIFEDEDSFKTSKNIPDKNQTDKLIFNNIINELCAVLINKFSEIECIIKYNQSHSPCILFGNDNFYYSIKDITFFISSKDFWQINFSQVSNLVDIVLKYANLSGSETVLDAYCGAGFFSLFLAKKCRYVYGVEVNSMAISNAKKNAAINNILNVKFIDGDVKNILSRNHFQKIDLLVIDPPRKGCEEIVIKKILDISPNKIIYVSCNPATLARDILLFTQNGYSVIGIQPIDMFPQTFHIECVVCLIFIYRGQETAPTIATRFANAGMHPNQLDNLIMINYINIIKYL